MSKKQQDLDYSFITPPAQPTQSSSSSHSVPSAPIADNSVPPSYEDATVPTATNAFPIPPRNNTNLNGYVLDSSSAPFNPNVGMPMPESINLTNRQEINSGDYAPYADSPVDQPMLGEFESRHEEYDNFAGRPAPPGYSLYRAKYLKTKSGVVSRDHHINSDGEALLQFLYQHNQCPRMKINFYGYHEETQWKTVTRQNSNGEHVHDREPETRRIDDFNFTMDASSYISPVCQGIYILPDPKTGEVKPLRELCNDYVHEKNLLKELKLTKEVNWDFTGLTRGLTTAIRNSGFYENVEIRFTFENDEVVVKTDHYISRWIDNKYIRFFFFITFLWIITWPIIWLTRKTFGHKTLKSAWNMNVSERDWYGLHVQEVIDACRGSNAFQRGNTNFTPPYIQFNGVFR